MRHDVLHEHQAGFTLFSYYPKGDVLVPYAPIANLSLTGRTDLVFQNSAQVTRVQILL